MPRLKPYRVPALILRILIPVSLIVITPSEKIDGLCVPGFIWSAPGNACARRLFYQWCKRRDVPCWNQKAGCCRCIPCGILPAWECGCPCKAGGMPSFRPGCVLLISVILYRSCFASFWKMHFPRVTSQVDVLVHPFDDCRESQISRRSRRWGDF